MLQPYARYRMRRAVLSLFEGEELTFITQYQEWDRDTGFHFDVLVFVEKTLSVYLIDEDIEEVSLLRQPSLYFEKIGEVDAARATEELAARRAYDRAKVLEEDRRRMLEKAQKRLEKQRKKYPKA